MQGTVDIGTLAALLREAGRAHHRAFASVNGAEPEWPSWYAQYLVARLEAVLTAPFAVPDLATELAALDAAQRAQAPGTDWRPTTQRRSSGGLRRGRDVRGWRRQPPLQQVGRGCEPEPLVQAPAPGRRPE